MTQSPTPFALTDVAEHISRTLALPAQLQAILQALGSEQFNMEDLSHRIETEQGLVVRLMRLANAPFYGVPGRVESVVQALRVIGLANTQSVVTSMITMGSLEKLKLNPDELSRMRTHSLSVAYLARRLAELAGLSQDMAFVSGLMHDFGKYVLMALFSEQYAPVLARGRTNAEPVTEAESALLGFNHADVGAELARIWHYPPRIERAIREHHDPAPTSEGLVLIVALANRLDNVDQRTAILGMESWRRLGLSQESLDAAVNETQATMKHLVDERTDEPPG